MGAFEQAENASQLDQEVYSPEDKRVYKASSVLKKAETLEKKPSEAPLAKNIQDGLQVKGGSVSMLAKAQEERSQTHSQIVSMMRTYEEYVDHLNPAVSDIP